MEMLWTRNLNTFCYGFFHVIAIQAKYKYRGMVEIQSPKTWQAQVKVVSTLEQMQVPNGTGCPEE